ncbi:hypothetical protein [Polynucleobacter sp. JS-Polo-80-F4]|uniref:hypothetical protein n=1 Tax=Polynucleobacter sp. JS-Polo-80-F4 TaxID=2576918 RepID=UPI001C0E8081|nr:hypothetical protein [Polynucleobacter sp. JS-Polo-80-F4]MBU3617283.1 hypothetical protein [Polynucleobacter sp. JS-Polo-80-F4]
MGNKRLALACIASLISAGALADQCAWVAPNVSARMDQLADSGQFTGKRYVEYCKTCGDNEPRGPFNVSGIKKKRVDANYSEYYFVTNGKDKSVDLAYVFIETRPGVFSNVGMMTSCLSNLDTSSEIRLK